MQLPSAMHVIERDWLNANHVLFLGEEAVLIDSGHLGGLETTRGEVQRLLGTRRLDLLVNTHCHSDHMGGNAALRREHACQIAIPEGEAARVQIWDTRALWLDYAGQRAERFDFDTTVVAGTTLRWGGLDWQALAAAGHSGAPVRHAGRGSGARRSAGPKRGHVARGWVSVVQAPARSWPARVSSAESGA